MTLLACFYDGDGSGDSLRFTSDRGLPPTASMRAGTYTHSRAPDVQINIGRRRSVQKESQILRAANSICLSTVSKGHAIRGSGPAVTWNMPR